MTCVECCQKEIRKKAKQSLSARRKGTSSYFIKQSESQLFLTEQKTASCWLFLARQRKVNSPKVIDLRSPQSAPIDNKEAAPPFGRPGLIFWHRLANKSQIQRGGYLAANSLEENAIFWHQPAEPGHYQVFASPLLFVNRQLLKARMRINPHFYHFPFNRNGRQNAGMPS